MYTRSLQQTIKDDLQKVPAVVLFGPRQVGKTTLVKQLAATDPEHYRLLDLELPSDRAKLTDAELFLPPLANLTVVLDEVQLVPALFPVLRSLIDQNRRPGRFLLLGSASPVLLQQSAESLAGRVRYRQMHPLTIAETSTDEISKLWIRGGFPEPYSADNDEDAVQWHRDFIKSYVTRDLPMLGLAMHPLQVERLLYMLAHTHGQLLNYSTLAKALGITVPTVTKAIHFLEEALLIRTLKPWHTNAGKRLVKTPKLYIRDTGMLHQLLGIGNMEGLLGHPQAGYSWEGFVVQQLIAHLPQGLAPFFYRTSAGAEIDLVIARGETALYSIEIKLGTVPQISRGNTEAASDLNASHQFVIYSKNDSFPLRQGWQAMGLAEAIGKLQA